MQALNFSETLTQPPTLVIILTSHADSVALPWSRQEGAADA
jgi:hypothetical protein